MLAGYLSCPQGRSEALATALQWRGSAIQNEGTLFSPNASRAQVTMSATIDLGPSAARPRLHDHCCRNEYAPAHQRQATHHHVHEKEVGVNPTMRGGGDPRARRLRLEQVPVPVPGPGEALVKVQAVGICASDLKCYHGAPMYWGDGPVPPNVDLLVIPGHEFVGEVVAIDDLGRQRWGVDTGDRVVAEQIVPVLEVPVLPPRPVLDVRAAQHLRVSPQRSTARWRSI